MKFCWFEHETFFVFWLLLVGIFKMVSTEWSLTHLASWLHLNCTLYCISQQFNVFTVTLHNSIHKVVVFNKLFLNCLFKPS